MKKEDIKTFEDACQVMGIDPEQSLPDFSNFPEPHREAMLAHAKLVIVSEALNQVENGGERWVPNWEDSSEYKYYPWFWMGSSGSGFSYGVYDDDDQLSYVGSRLCYISGSVAKYAGKQFEDLYKTYYMM